MAAEVSKTGAYALRHWQLYALLIVPLAYFVLFKYGPMYGTIIAFKEYNLFRGIALSPWNGFETFREVFGSSDFYVALRNTFVLNFLDLAISFPAPIALAIMLNEVRWSRFKKIAQATLYLPHFISWIIIGGMIYQVFATHTGIVNLLLQRLGIGPIPFLTDPDYWLATYLFAGVWQSAGWGTIIYLAAIAGINKELYDAAAVDGAGTFGRMRHVTLPGILPTIVVLLIVKIGEIIQIGFDRPYVLGNVSVNDVSEVLSTYVYKVGLGAGQFSFATAVGLFQSVVGLIFLVAANYFAKKTTDQSIF